MRIDLIHGGRRPWFPTLVLAVIAKFLFKPPGPPLFFSYRPDLLPPSFILFLARGGAAGGVWTQGEMELLGAFTSSLNSCHY